MTARNPIQADSERQSQTVTDDVWAVSNDGEAVSYRLADHTPAAGYEYLAGLMARMGADEDAILESLCGGNDHRVVATVAMDADSGEIQYVELADDLPRH